MGSGDLKRHLAHLARVVVGSARDPAPKVRVALYMYCFRLARASNTTERMDSLKLMASGPQPYTKDAEPRTLSPPKPTGLQCTDASGVSGTERGGS